MLTFKYKSKGKAYKTAAITKADLILSKGYTGAHLGIYATSNGMNSNDYSLTEISRLIETENAKILSSTVKEDELDPLKIKLTIKINKTELAHIVATLERFGYKIIARYQESDQDNNEQERLNQLLKFLDI